MRTIIISIIAFFALSVTAQADPVGYVGLWQYEVKKKDPICSIYFQTLGESLTYLEKWETNNRKLDRFLMKDEDANVADSGDWIILNDGTLHRSTSCESEYWNTREICSGTFLGLYKLETQVGLKKEKQAIQLYREKWKLK